MDATTQEAPLAVWVAGGHRGRKSLALFERWKAAGIVVTRWWDGHGKEAWQSVYKSAEPVQHLLVLTRWMSHGGFATAQRTAATKGMRRVTIGAVGPVQVRARINHHGVEPDNSEINNTEVTSMGRKNNNENRRQWTVGELLTVCTMRASGASWPTTARAINAPNSDTLSKVYANARRRVFDGDGTKMAEVLHTFGDQHVTMREFGKLYRHKQQQQQQQQEPAPTPTEADESFALAVEQAERADKAEYALATLHTEHVPLMIAQDEAREQHTATEAARVLLCGLIRDLQGDAEAAEQTRVAMLAKVAELEEHLAARQLRALATTRSTDDVSMQLGWTLHAICHGTGDHDATAALQQAVRLYNAGRAGSR